MAAPLTAVCSPRAEFAWGPAEQPSFESSLGRHQSGADVGAGAARVGTGAADGPDRRRLGGGRAGRPGAARRRGRVSSRRLRVQQLEASRSAITRPTCARAQGTAALTPRQAH